MTLDERIRSAARRYAIQQAADGNQDALAYIVRDFIADAKQRIALDPKRVVADVLERLLAGENIGKILGTQVKRGRPPEYKNAILVHAMVRYWMLLPILRPELMQRQDGDAKVAVAKALGIPLDTVQENCKRVSKLIRRIKANPLLDLEGRGVGPEDQLYLRDPENFFLLMNVFAKTLFNLHLTREGRQVMVRIATLYSRRRCCALARASSSY